MTTLTRTMPRPSTGRRSVLLVAGALAFSSACASAPGDGVETLTVAPLDEVAYASLVHPVVERACGSASCHGKAPRGFRVYGAGALRLSEADGGPASAFTSAAEIRATYVSLVGLEPEKLNAFVAGQPRSLDEAYGLLILAKPLALERHRGGISLRKGEAAEQCILSWLMGAADPNVCAP
jgi:hypothetical protein